MRKADMAAAMIMVVDVGVEGRPCP
jgi:hypothetical protein